MKIELDMSPDDFQAMVAFLDFVSTYIPKLPKSMVPNNLKASFDHLPRILLTLKTQVNKGLTKPQNP
jgi:hypothetical protein